MFMYLKFAIGDYLLFSYDLFFFLINLQPPRVVHYLSRCLVPKPCGGGNCRTKSYDLFIFFHLVVK
jgi:hypothetical protein